MENYETRFHEVMWRMLEKALSNKEWCEKEDPFTITLLAVEKDIQKNYYQRSKDCESETNIHTLKSCR